MEALVKHFQAAEFTEEVGFTSLSGPRNKKLIASFLFSLFKTHDLAPHTVKDLVLSRTELVPFVNRS